MTECPIYRHSRVMLLSAQEETHTSTMIVLGFIGGALLLYGLGYARAVMHRANRDYKTTKAAVPTLRKGFWSSWWRAVKAGLAGVIVFALLVLWMTRENRHDGPVESNMNPSPSVSVKHPAK